MEATGNTTQDKSLAKANAILQPLVPYGRLDALKEMARRIGFTNGGKHGLTVMEAVHAAQMAIATGANPFNGELYLWVSVDRNDKRSLTLHWGRAYWVRLANEWAEEHGTSFSPPEYWKILSPEDKALYDAKPDDIVYRCIVRDDKSMDAYVRRVEKLTEAKYTKDEIQKIVGKPPVYEGIGIVSREEIKEKYLEKTNSIYPNDERCMKRALMNALKKKVTFSTPMLPSPSDNEGYIKMDWAPEGAKELVIDTMFIPTEDESTATVGQDIPDDFKDLESEWKKHFESGKASQYTEEQMVDRRKPGYWAKTLIDTAMERELAPNAFSVAGRLAYSPYRAGKGTKKDGGRMDAGSQAQALEWLGWYEMIHRDAPVALNAQEKADHATLLVVRIHKSIEDAFEKMLAKASEAKEEADAETDQTEGN